MNYPVSLIILYCYFSRTLDNWHWNVCCTIRRFLFFFPCKSSWQVTWDDTMQTYHQHCQCADLFLFIHLICIWIICIPVTMLGCLSSCHKGWGFMTKPSSFKTRLFYYSWKLFYFIPPPAQARLTRDRQNLFCICRIGYLIFLHNAVFLYKYLMIYWNLFL